MNLIADEGIDVPVVNYLRANGHHVLYILEDSPGMPDSDILQLAQDRNEVLRYMIKILASWFTE